MLAIFIAIIGTMTTTMALSIVFFSSLLKLNLRMKNELPGEFKDEIDEHRDIYNFKLYIMVGLPTENKEDLEGIVSTVKMIKHLMLKKAKGTKKIGHLNISSSCFVPKPHTPFEDQSMDSLKSFCS